MILLVFITAEELSFALIITPLYTILVLGFYKWLFSRLIYKIHINESELTVELEKESIKIRWPDIEHIYVERKWGGTKLKIKISNADIVLPRKSFHLWTGSSSDEADKMLVRALKKIGNFADLKFNNNIKNLIDFWNKYDVQEGP
jgi:hypothetical protein